ncbi:hypothetical protein QE152_g29672 [Popillia japonica]|uniref:Uncharacterized protein n=1 Tax=Popillia japonica TaxID=7064 RepID=A0AAW1JI50_POPJA
MENLGQKIGYNITQAHTKEVKALHKLVFEYEGDRNNRKRLRFNFKDREDEKDHVIKRKTDYAMNNLTLGELRLIWNVLGTDNNANNKEELIDFLCKKLDDVSVLTEKDVSNNDDDGEENDVNTLVKSKGDSEDGNVDLNDVHGASAIGIVESHSRSQKTTPKFMMTFKDVEETVINLWKKVTERRGIAFCTF